MVVNFEMVGVWLLSWRLSSGWPSSRQLPVQRVPAALKSGALALTGPIMTWRPPGVLPLVNGTTLVTVRIHQGSEANCNLRNRYSF